ncbi:MAG: hypothetical protein L0G22_06630, partial [Propionibacteriaceae bacterium]|nr:hypothetical protein [Propionibacteriaceae bacterium]
KRPAWAEANDLLRDYYDTSIRTPSRASPRLTSSGSWRTPASASSSTAECTAEGSVLGDLTHGRRAALLLR